MYDDYSGADRETVRVALAQAVAQLSKRYEGVAPISAVILLETLRRQRGRATFDLPIDDIAHDLRETIRNNWSKLAKDLSAEGRTWSEGWIGELYRRRNLIHDLGGPEIMP